MWEQIPQNQCPNQGSPNQSNPNQSNGAQGSQPLRFICQWCKSEANHTADKCKDRLGHFKAMKAGIENTYSVPLVLPLLGPRPQNECLYA